MAPETPESRLARLEEQLRAQDRIVETFGPTAGQLIKTEARLDEAVRDLADFKAWIGDVETRLRSELGEVATECRSIHQAIREARDAEQERAQTQRAAAERALREDVKARRENRWKYGLAIAGLAVTFLCSIIAAAAAVLA